jgi:UDP-N-acetylmuramoyl-L-alanyl-D-glutamate--2,6-diaminopimelate ligase
MDLHSRAGVLDLELTGLTADSREVRPGFLFAALPGTHQDGRAFIDDAIARGAIAVLAPPGTLLAPACAERVALVTDANPRRRLALMAGRFYVLQPHVVVAVTGTNGKTSVVEFARQIWTAMGVRAASIGTLGVRGEVAVSNAPLTTPDPVTLHRVLRTLAEGGVGHLAMEASSHGLEQCRLDGVRLSAAAFTNLGRDHLDYHGDAEAYLRAKTRLFATLLPNEGAAVLNADVPEFAALERLCRDRGHQVFSYGRRGGDLRLIDATPIGDGQRLVLEVLGRDYDTRVPLVGDFQIANVLAALGLVLACDGDADIAVGALPRLAGVRGRLEQVARHPGGAPIFVDYAHTPDALETVLTALRPHTAGRLVVVFGAGGDRDRGKRPLMGRVAARLADRVFVTDDNPRTENPSDIRRAIMEACPGATEIGDRAQAIHAAVGTLAAGDVLVIAGKGHESGQIVGNTTTPFDDATVARAAVSALGGRR